MALGSTQPVRWADNLTTLMCRFSRNSGNHNILQLSGPVKTCTEIALPLLLVAVMVITRASHIVVSAIL